jgi:hypothetical protein
MYVCMLAKASGNISYDLGTYHFARLLTLPYPTYVPTYQFHYGSKYLPS